jgi:hypothetical protein
MLFSEQTFQWIIQALAIYVAMLCLMSLAKRLREHLQGLLIEHVKRQQIESKKRQRINELRDMIRKRKADSAAAAAAEQEAEEQQKRAA